MPRIKKSSGKSRMWAAALGAVALAVMGVGAFAVPAPASATDSGTCVPSAAWDETVVDKAAWTEVIPAVTQTIHHDAVTHTAYQRYSWTGGPIEGAPSEVPPGPDWQANTTNYEGAGHGTDPVNQPFQQGKPGKGDWFYWTATEVVDQPASDEVVVVTPEQTIEHPAITHVVHHDAVTCPPPDGWTPKSSVVLLAADCYAGGTNVAGLVSDSVNIASGEQLVSITFNGAPVGDFGPMVSAAGTYTYSYVIKNTATGETYTSPDKTVTIESCTVTPPKPATPTVAVKCDHCSDADAANGSATITVTNTADDTKASATYSVTLNGVTKSVTIADGQSGNVNFSGLAPGTYDVTVTGNDDTSATASVTVDKCDVTPPVLPKDASASITVVAPTCKADGSVIWGHLVNAVAMDLDQSVGTHVALSPAVEGHLFADGTTSWQQEYTIQPKLTGKDCDVTPPVTPPVVTPPVTPPAPPVVPPATDDHTLPTKVQTDGDSSPLFWGMGLLIAIALASVGGAGVLVARRRS